jgi:hypothetical protein
MKKKANGEFRARVTAHGFEQIDGEQYDSSDIAAPVVSEITIHILFILIAMAQMYAELLDVCGAFLLGKFDAHHKMYMKVPKGFEKFYANGVVLLLMRTLYGTKQAAMAFWKFAAEIWKALKLLRSNADPCLHFTWTIHGLIMWVSWVDDYIGAGQKEDVLETKERIKAKVKVEEIGELKEYIGCKIDRDIAGRSIKVTQPVLIQSLADEFELPDKYFSIPAPAGDVLVGDDEEDETLDSDEHSKYRSGVGKLLHLAKWSRVDILNRVRELSRFMTSPKKSHMKAMLRCMRYVVDTPDRGVLLKPLRAWDGKDRSFQFKVSGMADADYATDKETRRSVSGYCTFLEGALVSAKSRMQKCITLSTTEAEFMAMTDCAQDMLYIMRVLQSLLLQVELPMLLQCDNKGAVDLANNWSTAGRTRHVATKIMFLRELKEQGLLKVEWVPATEMTSDVFTKNLGDGDFLKCVSRFSGEGEVG